MFLSPPPGVLILISHLFQTCNNLPSPPLILKSREELATLGILGFLFVASPWVNRFLLYTYSLCPLESEAVSKRNAVCWAKPSPNLHLHTIQCVGSDLVLDLIVFPLCFY